MPELPADQAHWVRPGLELAGPHRHGIIRDPEVAELRAFCAAASLGSIGAAARTLGVTQPALSKRLRTLEVVVGAALFERSTRGVRLTAEGVHLYGVARRLLQTADVVQALIAGSTLERTVRLAAASVISETRLGPVLSDFAQVEPGVPIEVVCGGSTFVRELVREGRTDLGIAAVDPDVPLEHGLGEKVIWRDELVVGVPPGHPWGATEEVPAEHFASTQLIEPEPGSTSSRLVAAAFQYAGIERVAPLAAIGSLRGRVALARATGTPALISMMAARNELTGELVMRRVSGMRFDQEFALIWPAPIPTLDLPVQALANHILDMPFARSRRRSRAAS